MDLAVAKKSHRRTFQSGPVIQCDGRTQTDEWKAPEGLSFPLWILEAYAQLHTGTAPIAEVGGLLNIVLFRASGESDVLLSMMNRHGAARWVFSTPVVLEERDKVVCICGSASRTVWTWRPRPRLWRTLGFARVRVCDSIMADWALAVLEAGVLHRSQSR